MLRGRRPYSTVLVRYIASIHNRYSLLGPSSNIIYYYSFFTAMNHDHYYLASSGEKVCSYVVSIARYPDAPQQEISRLGNEKILQHRLWLIL